MHTRQLHALRKLGLLSASLLSSSILQSMFRRIFRNQNTSVIVNDFDGTLSLPLNLRDHMQRRVFWMGYYNREIIPFLKKYLRADMVVIDIGANFGEISLVSAKRVGMNGLVYAFEPIRDIAEQLLTNARANSLDQIHVIQKGLSNHVSDKVPIYAPDSSDENMGLGTLFARNEECKPIQLVQTTTLDHWLVENPLHRLDLIKIDIEGSELDCLHGAEDCIRSFQPALIVEIQDSTARSAGYHTDEVLSFLSSMDYEPYRLDKRGLVRRVDGSSFRAGMENVLFYPRSKQAALRPLQ